MRAIASLKKALELLLEIKVGHGQRLGTIEQRVEESLRGRLSQEHEKTGETAEKKLEKAFEKITPGTSPEALAKIKLSVIKQTKATIDDFYTAVKMEVPTIAETVVQRPLTVPVENLEKLVDWMIENESKSEYVTKKLLHRIIFGNDPAIAAAIGYAVNSGIFCEFEHTPKKKTNLKLPAVRLNADHPFVKERMKKRS